MTVRLYSAPDAQGSPLLLRPWSAHDISALLDAYRDPVLRRRSSARPTDERTVRSWPAVQRRGWDDGDRLSLAVQGEGRVLADVVLKGLGAAKPVAEVGYWTTAAARGRGVAGRALRTLTSWAFERFAGEGLERLHLLHQVGDHASCRVAHKCGYALERTLPAVPPLPHAGHLHVRHRVTRSPCR